MSNNPPSKEKAIYKIWHVDLVAPARFDLFMDNNIYIIFYPPFCNIHARDVLWSKFGDLFELLIKL